MEPEQIRVKINSCYSVGRTDAFRSKFGAEEDLTMTLKAGTTVNELLLQLPGIGSPEEWDDINLHVFVNHHIVDLDEVLRNDDVVDLHIPSSGG